MLAEFAVYQLNSLLVREGKYASFLMERKPPKQSLQCFNFLVSMLEKAYGSCQHFVSLINFDERKLLPPLLGCVAGDLNYSKSGEEKGYENEPEVTRRMGWKQRETSPQTNRQPRRLTFANSRTSALNDEELKPMPISHLRQCSIIHCKKYKP